MSTADSSLWKHFDSIPDPRVVGRTTHKLFDILFIAVAACIANCDDWGMVELWAKERIDWLRRYCELPNGIPSHDTFSRVLASINPDTLHSAFVAGMKEIQEITEGDVVAIDGKTLRRSFDRSGDGKGAIHMVSAWLSKNRVVLGQLKVEDKSNEITAIPKLLLLLELKGALVTIDAMGCQKDIAGAIIAGEANYLLAVKDNQPTLSEDVENTFKKATVESVLSFETTSEGHGRVEVRKYTQCLDLSLLRTAFEWPGLKRIVKVESMRFLNSP